MSVITLESVSKSFRGRPIFRDVSLEIEEGTVVAITGPNGSGKSVLFRVMCGFLLPDSGSVTISPKFLSRARTFPEDFGIIIDRPGYLAGKSGIDNLRELARIRGVIGDVEIQSTMSELGLSPSLKQKVRHYSLGMKQKLAIAQAIMEKPRVLLLDEPFNALDVDSVANVKRILKDLNKAGVTVVFSSHSESDVKELANKRFTIQNEQVVMS